APLETTKKSGSVQSGRVAFRGLRARRKSRWKIYLGILGGWLITLAVVLAIYSNLFFYSEYMPIMSRETKRQFNALITGLSIALGITVVKGLNEFVSTLRWWLLSRHCHSLRKVDLILQAESVSRVLLLGFRTRRIAVHAAACLWLCLILAAQVSLALLGLCFSVETQEALALVIKDGQVSVPDMSSIQTARIVKVGPDSVEAQEYTANSYGLISLAYETSQIDQIPDIGSIWTASNPLVFCDADHCEYVFHERSVGSIEDNDGDNGNTSSGDQETDDEGQHDKVLVVTTNRRATARADCHSWRVIDGANGNSTRITIDTTGDGATENDNAVFVPVQGGVNQTTYITNNLENCGAGCRIVTALEVLDAGAWYYSCNVSVSDASNATMPEHQISTELRSMAAASIALQGSAELSVDEDNDVQHRIYPAESLFGMPMEGLDHSMAINIARFSIGTLAVAAQFNNPLVINGRAPVKGSHLVVDYWGYVILILNSVLVAQLALGILTAVIASKVIIPEGGPIAIAQLLRLMAEHVQSSEQGDTMTNMKDKGGLWIYTAVETEDEGVYDVFMQESDVREDTGEDIEMH
ncbi:hypothetical protein CCHL11_05148, partial [Colletotrichum chlorophyti]